MPRGIIPPPAGLTAAVVACEVLGRLKIRHLILPLLVLAIGGANFVRDRRALAAAEKRADEIHARAAVPVRTGEIPDSESALARLADPAREPDWRQIARRLREFERLGPLGNSRLSYFLDRRLAKMLPAEIADSIDLVATLELAPDERAVLLYRLAIALAGREPDLLLTRFPEFVAGENESLRGAALSAYGTWLGSDFQAATAWFEREIAAGRFVEKGLGKGTALLEDYERPLIRKLVRNDIAAVSRRLDDLPLARRDEVFPEYFSVPAGQEGEFGEMVRDKITGEVQGRLVAAAARVRWETGRLPAVADFLDAVGADSEARGDAAVLACNADLERTMELGATFESVDELRKWSATAAPDAVGAVTGTALAAFVTDDPQSFADAAARAAAYAQADGDDHALKMFLRLTLPQDDSDLSRVRAAAVADPALREIILRRIR